MALKELLKQRVMEKLNFSQEISDEHLKGVIQEEIMKISEEYPLLLSDKIRLNQEVFYALRRLDILQDLLEDDSVTEIMINGYKNIFIERQGKLHRYPGHFSDNEKLIGRPTNFDITVREFEISSGAGFVVPLLGDVMRMPGLPAVPNAERIDIDNEGRITGLS